MKYFHSQVLKCKKINDRILNKSYSRFQLFSLIYHNPEGKMMIGHSSSELNAYSVSHQ